MSRSYPTVPSRPRDGSTRASRRAWIPITLGIGGLLAGLGTGGLYWIGAGAAVFVAGAHGAYLYTQHRSEQAELAEDLFEERALDVYRSHRGAEMTKEQLVRDHRLHPDQADKVLAWLVNQELLQPDWTDLERPVIYRRSDTPDDALPAPPPSPPPVTSSSPSSAPQVHLTVSAPLVPVAPKSEGLAAAISFFWPGIGQIYAGDTGRGLGWFFATMVGYAMLVVPGFVLHIMSIFDAAKTARRTNEEARRLLTWQSSDGSAPKPTGPLPRGGAAWPKR